MSTRRGSMTAEEHAAILATDPAYQARIREQDRQFQEQLEKDRAEETALVADVRAVGIDIESVWDLVNRPNDYQPAYPVLVEHLGREYSAHLKEAIARALTVADAAEIAWEPILAAFRAHGHRGPGDPPPLKFALGNALAKLMDEEHIAEALGLVTNPEHGESRARIVDFLGDFNKRDDVRQALESLQNDRDVATEARKALRRKRRRRKRG